jgi:DNA-directed RNA polymerase omega subunit
MPQYVSRGTFIDTQKCVENVGGNRFNLVIIAANRARELARNNKHSLKHEHVHTTVTALLEVQEGKIGKDYIKRIKFPEPRNMVDRGANFR